MFRQQGVVPSSLKHAIVDCWCRSCVRYWVSVRKLVRSPCQVRCLNIEISIFELSPRREAHFWTTILKHVTRGATVREVGRTCLQGLLLGLHFHFDRQKPWFGAHFFRSPIRFACQILEGRLYQNFDFLSSRLNEKLIFDLNVKTNCKESDCQGGWRKVSGRAASWTAVSFRSSKIVVRATFCSCVATWTNPG